LDGRFREGRESNESGEQLPEKARGGSPVARLLVNELHNLQISALVVVGAAKVKGDGRTRVACSRRLEEKKQILLNCSKSTSGEVQAAGTDDPLRGGDAGKVRERGTSKKG